MFLFQRMAQPLKEQVGTGSRDAAASAG